MNGGSLSRLRELVRKEFLQIRRDPKLRRVIFVAPLIQLLVFGYAVSTDIRDTPTFIVDHDGSLQSRQLIEAFAASGYFAVVGRSERPADLVSALDHGSAIVGLEIPAGFARDLGEGAPVQVQLLVDGTNSNVATIALGYAERVVASFGARQSQVARPAASSGVIGVDLRERAWFNPNLESRNYNVPAVVGAIMMLICLLLTSLAVVREREIGTLEQLMVSPLRPVELMLGKALPFAVIGLIDLALILTVALAWFRIPFRGSFALLLLASLLFLLSALGTGLLVSTISKTQQEAFMVSLMVFNPTMLLSGFMFPVASMPEFFQWVTLANPLRHYLEIVRAIFLKGAGFTALWPQHLALLVIGVAVLGLATTRFRKTAG